MNPGTFSPRFVPSTAARRFVLAEDEQTEMMPDRLLRDRADTVRIAMPERRHPLLEARLMAAAALLVASGLAVGWVVARLFV